MNQDTDVDVIEDEVDAEDAPEQDTEGQGDEPDQSADSEGGETDESDEVVVSIGDDAPSSDDDSPEDSTVIRALRQANRELVAERRKLKEQLNATPAAPKAVELGKKPTLESSDYDTERFEQDLEAWHQRKRDYDAKAEQDRQAKDNAEKAWQAQLDNFKRLKGELKVKDFDDAQALAEDTLSTIQQGLIVQGADNSAQVIYALGKNPTEAKRLAAITDPVKFAFAVAKLETKLKVTPRKTAPLPERTPRGSAPVSGAVDSKLARLEADAEKTGDRTAIARYRKELKAKGK